jgi:arginase
MPISVALGLGPAAWVEAAGGAATAPERTALVGFRDRAESIADGMRRPEELDSPPLLYGAEELRERGVAAAAAELAARLGTGPFWLHLDVDVLDEAVFPATDYLQPGGLDWDELGALLAVPAGSDAMVGASLACYNPDKDPGLACGRRLVAALAG